MSSELTITQRRYTSIAEGLPRYHIEASVTRTPGVTIVPTVVPNVFVFTLGTSAVTDVFTRVATIADLDLLYPVREDSATAGHTEFLSSVVVLTFDDVDTAIAAIPVIRDRINLVTTLRVKAAVDFNHAGEVVTLPVAVEVDSVKEGLTAAYTSARDARKLKETAQALMQAAYVTKQSGVDTLEIERDVHCITYVPGIATVKSLADDAHLLLSDAEVLIATLATAVGVANGTVTPEAESSKAAFLASKALVVDGSTGLVARATALLTIANAACSASLSGVRNEEVAEAASLASLREAQAATSTAQTTENTAAAKLREYCPDLDFSKV